MEYLMVHYDKMEGCGLNADETPMKLLATRNKYKLQLKDQYKANQPCYLTKKSADLKSQSWQAIEKPK